ncbi:uncharacterized protein F4807DRAFT_157214 [Annulohypoxylon truncatum]|uniref:uncharacterized protein n=1 Tax=Annulohypoxylon truncatum TaxID=327061 RepID=UPI0020089542|nr:uncharacterized protein F4807DRAFT_157214 [Annulohypoxylon truncatum]KAI1208243.1 hypothetical protein F4807DRAFT_157214 [Annulohypoxylon truncatum]
MMFQAYTARMCSQWPDDIAMSSTYLIDRRLNLSVYYGCSEQQSLDLMDRLSRAGNAILHPMIASGILAELDRKRLFECVELATDAFVSSTEMLCCPSISPETVIDQEGQNMTQLSDLYNNSRELAKNIRKVECQISDMRTHICDFDARESQGHRSLKSKKPTREKFDAYLNASSPGTQIHARLLEIENEYEDKLNTCSMIPDSLAFTAQIAANHANNRMAYDTQTKNTQMRTIALMTMIYLPVTSVASIFSMGVFNWTASEQQSVLTSYFWVYVAVAGCLTVLTLGIWWTLTRAQRRQYDSDIDIEKLM